MAEDVLPCPPRGVFDDDHNIVDGLVHEKPENHIVVMQIRVPEVELAVGDYHVQIALVVQD